MSLFSRLVTETQAERTSAPGFETEMMVSCACDLVKRVNPLEFFGMVHVLEGTSVAVADNAAGAIRNLHQDLLLNQAA